MIPLRLHTHYSIKRGLGTPEEYIKLAKEKGYTHLAITDYFNNHGWINFWNAAKKAEIQPIFGTEFAITNDMTSRGKPNFSHINRGNDTLILLAKNNQGYKDILYINTIANKDENYFLVPRIDYDFLSEFNVENLVCIVPNDFSTVSKLLMEEQDVAARRLIRMLKGLFGEDLYVEISANPSPINKSINQKLLELANKQKIKCIVSSNIHYPLKEDNELFNIHLAIGEKKTYAENDIYSLSSDTHYLMSEDDVKQCLHENDLENELIEELIRNTDEIGVKTTFDLNFPDIGIPDPPLPEGYNSNEKYLLDLMDKGWNNKILPRINSGEWDEIKEEDIPIYEARKDYEFNMIKNIFTMKDPNHIMKEGFIPYVLIVRDYVTWAKGIDRRIFQDAPIIEVGPARGSVSGSLLCYLVDLQTVDPIPWGLTFERFINPERVSWPDIDMDFSPDTAWWVEKYLIETYGIDRVAHIITFQTAAGKKAFESISKVLSGSYGKFKEKVKQDKWNTNAQLLPIISGEAREVQDLIDPQRKIKDQLNPDAVDPDGNSLYNPPLAEKAKLTKFKKIFELMVKYEGTITSTGSHPGACVITKESIWNHCSVINNGGKYPDDSVLYVTSYEKYNMEDCNTMKYDILRLAELTIVREALKFIKESTGEIVDLDKINPFDIKTNIKILRLLKEGDTNGVFQFSSKLYQGIIEEVLGNLDHLPEESVAEDLFNIIIALEALGRPGPLEGGMVPTFANGLANPDKIDKIHPEVDDVLKETYGNMLYQEQVMFILMRMGGFSLGQADMVRRGIASGKREKIEEQRQPFLEGVKKVQLEKFPNTADEEMEKLLELAHHIFDLMAKWAGYGFNKAHSVGYGFLSYRGAYLKVNFKPQFMAALMSSNAGNEDKIIKYVDSIRASGVKILQPRINKATKGFTVVGEDILFGLEAIKGVGEKAIEDIVSKYPFNSILDFMQRTDSRSCGARVLLPLIKAGYFNEDKKFLLKYWKALNEIQKGNTRIEESLINFISENGITESTQEDIEKRINKIIDEKISKKRTQKTKDETANLIDNTEYSSINLLNMEKEVLGMYLSENPLDEYSDIIYGCTVLQKDFKRYTQKEEIFIVGIAIETPPIRIDKNGNEMAFVKIQLLDGIQDCVVFHQSYAKYKSLLTEGRIIIAKGKKGRGGGFQIQSVADLEQKEDLFRDFFKIPKVV